MNREPQHSTRAGERMDIAWIDARRRLNLMLARGRGILPFTWILWAEALHGPDTMLGHPFAPWHELAGWYIEQIELFITDAEAYIALAIEEHKPRKVA